MNSRSLLLAREMTDFALGRLFDPQPHRLVDLRFKAPWFSSMRDQFEIVVSGWMVAKNENEEEPFLFNGELMIVDARSHHPRPFSISLRANSRAVRARCYFDHPQSLHRKIISYELTDADCLDGMVGSLLVYYGRGKLTPPDKALFEKHLSVCEACRVNLNNELLLRRHGKDVFGSSAHTYPAI